MKNWEKETIEKLKKLPGKISFYYRSLDSEDTAEYQACLLYTSPSPRD